MVGRGSLGASRMETSRENGWRTTSLSIYTYIYSASSVSTLFSFTNLHTLFFPIPNCDFTGWTIKKERNKRRKEKGNEARMETLQLAGSSTQPRDDNGMSLIRLFRDLPFPFSSLMTGWMVRRSAKRTRISGEFEPFPGLAFQRWKEVVTEKRVEKRLART